MRMSEFMIQLRESFPLVENPDLARDVAEAMCDASKIGGGQIGSFEHDGATYFVETKWVDHCLNYDCNPATCYTDWRLTTCYTDWRLTTAEVMK